MHGGGAHGGAHGGAYGVYVGAARPRRQHATHPGSAKSSGGATSTQSSSTLEGQPSAEHHQHHSLLRSRLANPPLLVALAVLVAWGLRAAAATTTKDASSWGKAMGKATASSAPGEQEEGHDVEGVDEEVKLRRMIENDNGVD